ncbi:MAG: DoxX family protein [Pseudobdellovibrionaceae bacterium]
MKKKIAAAIPELLSRLTIGLVFIQSGWGKIHNLAKVTAYFESLHIPLSSIQAPFVAGVELVAGSLILVGLFTRFASIPLIGTMIVALLTAKREELTEFSSVFSTIEFLYIVILVWLLANGASFLSLDKMRCKCSKKGSCHLK